MDLVFFFFFLGKVLLPVSDRSLIVRAARESASMRIDLLDSLSGPEISIL
jgi:hypothetical protein